MDLLTVILPFVGAAAVWAYNAYVKKTGVDPLANRPLLKALFDALAKGLPAQQQINLATQLGLHNDPGFLQELMHKVQGQAWDDALKLQMPAPAQGLASSLANVAPPAPADAYGGNLVHVPIKLTITPEFLHPNPEPLPPDPGPAAPAIKLAAA